MASPPLLLLLLLVAFAGGAAVAGDSCSMGCGFALGSYYVAQNQSVTQIAELFGFADYRTLAQYNTKYSSLDYIQAGDRVNVSFSCDCLVLPSAPATTFLAGSVPHKVASADTYTTIADRYHNLTTAAWLQETNTYPPNNIPDIGTVNVTVNCSCGDPGVSKDYGLFLTYPLRDSETLASVAARSGFSSPEQMDTLRKYNPGMDGVTGRGIVFIPAKGELRTVFILLLLAVNCEEFGSILGRFRYK